jgi:hypothetical protein
MCSLCIVPTANIVPATNIVDNLTFLAASILPPPATSARILRFIFGTNDIDRPPPPPRGLSSVFDGEDG